MEIIISIAEAITYVVRAITNSLGIWVGAAAFIFICRFAHKR